MVRWVCLALAAAAAAGTAAVALEDEAVPIPDRALLVGDVVEITVVGERDLSRRAVIGPTGTVSLGYAGAVRVAGLTPVAAAAAIRRALLRYLRDPEVSVELAEQRFSVLGAVVRPGQYALPGDGIPVLDALAQAGGPSDRANLRCVTLVRQTPSGPRQYRLDVFRAIAARENGERAGGLPQVQSGDVLYVRNRRPPLGSTLLSVAGVLASIAWVLR